MALDVTSWRTNSGKWFYAFDGTAVNGTEQIFLKAGDDSKAAFYVEFAQIVCGSGAISGIFDGSGGDAILGLIDGGETGGGYCRIELDSREDPIPILADSTSSCCITGPAKGFISGTIKGYWGP